MKAEGLSSKRGSRCVATKLVLHCRALEIIDSENG